ncbi:FAD-containing monooxygenase EthA [Hahella sp. CCB-MM4]|uniref:flavin-containing monooxygenase n=1 Tax=Hahella sp. (strain CCB-MM4) TaxID=1926491 RepID=UPI000B9AF063|nr:NAD(P)/FAD-dependent oxidoreductase [Hahella sp. CCB-MM4]OZG74883.1 FAD-containing monooxygenase EthA [Hahella sp. CCB-MM4]
MATQYSDVLIIGAGLSGIGAACHIRRELPDKSFVILERRQAIGGTWDLFRYPGIRSDSDMYTLGYNFKAWSNPQAIADGPAIREYIRETASEYHVEEHIRFGNYVKRAYWDSSQATWTVEALDEQSGEVKRYCCRFLLCCSGYYNYDGGYQPEFPGQDQFAGQIIHPQKWPEDLDYTGKKVVVIGSGATAVTLVPAMADKVEHITMLQRSPTYILSLPREDAVSNFLRRFLPEKMVYRLARTRNIFLSLLLYKLSRAFPQGMANFIRKQALKQTGAGVDAKHFSPYYKPWDERLCIAPDGDLFEALRGGNASIVTDQVECLTDTGIRLKSGAELEADIVVTATGLAIQPLGGAELYLDGKPFDITRKLCYKGVMLQDMPNLGLVFGYTNASWTLKADIVTEYLLRVIRHMDQLGVRQCMPRNSDDSVEFRPFLDMTSGYVQRAEGTIPHQGSKAPWKLHQNYALDLMMLRYGKLEDGVLSFSNPVGETFHTAPSSVVADSGISK